MMSKMNATNGHTAPPPSLWNRLWGLARAEAKQRLAEPVERPQEAPRATQEAPRATGGDHTCLIRVRTSDWIMQLYISSEPDAALIQDQERARKFSCPGAAADWYASRPERMRSAVVEIVRLDGMVVTELTEEIIGSAASG
jgi:hypothetical protein